MHHCQKKIQICHLSPQKMSLKSIVYILSMECPPASPIKGPWTIIDGYITLTALTIWSIKSMPRFPLHVPRHAVSRGEIVCLDITWLLSMLQVPTPRTPLVLRRPKHKSGATWKGTASVFAEQRDILFTSTIETSWSNQPPSLTTAWSTVGTSTTRCRIVQEEQGAPGLEVVPQTPQAIAISGQGERGAKIGGEQVLSTGK